jgi:hypothetical protein
VLPIGEGRYLLAEQGRNRILEFRRLEAILQTATRNLLDNTTGPVGK